MSYTVQYSDVNMKWSRDTTQYY